MLRDVAPRRWLWIAVVIAGVVVLVGGLVTALQIRVMINPAGQHAGAVARWQAAAIDDYRVFVAVEGGFSTDGVYRLTVADGTLTDAAIYNTLTYRYDPNAPAFDVPTSQAAAYTVEALFEQAADLTAQFGRAHSYTPTTSHVIYHADDGYVARYVNNTCGWLIAQQVDACITHVEVLRFEPITSAE